LTPGLCIGRASRPGRVIAVEISGRRPSGDRFSEWRRLSPLSKAIPKLQLRNSSATARSR